MGWMDRVEQYYIDGSRQIAILTQPIILYFICILIFRTTVVETVKLGMDVNRHKEIIVKSISGLFLLLLKWFKLNHVYQV